MSIPMPMQETIRELDAQGVPGREIARRLGVSRNTVAKYAGIEDYSPRPVLAGSHVSKADAFAGVITQWLLGDEHMPRKQRHTARRVFDRLVDEHGYEGSYSSVQRWIKRWRAGRRSEGDGFAELGWEPGVAQVDYGQADAVIAGVRQVVHVLVVTWPYSNMRYAVLTPGENAECVCAGLRRVFEHVDAAPTKLVFDNATGVGHRRSDGQVTSTHVFDAFRAHYRCGVELGNPYSGNEKGSVENAVGFIRRNLMVPIPHVRTLAGLSDALLARCDDLAAATHYRKGQSINTLFETDRATMLGLPGIGFDACRWESRVVDKVGNIVIDGARYLAGARLSGQAVNVGLRAATVTILDAAGTQVARLPRAYGDTPATVHDPAGLLAVLVRKPRAWEQSILRADTPEALTRALDDAGPAERSRLLRILAATANTEGFTVAAAAMERIITAGATPQRAETLMLAKRITQGESTPERHVDLSVYDRFTDHRHQAAS